MKDKFKCLPPIVTRKMTLNYLASVAKYLRKALEHDSEMTVKELYDDTIKALRIEGYDTNSIVLD